MAVSTLATEYNRTSNIDAVSAGGSKSFNIENGTRSIVFVLGVSTAAIYAVSSNSSGSVAFTPVVEDETISFTTSGVRRFTVSNSANSGTPSINAIVFIGGISKASS